MLFSFFKFLGVGCLVIFWVCPVRATQEINVDVCVYGGTSGGVIAAVQAARMGKSVALVALNHHVGGMTTSGLGWTDVGHVDNNSADYIQGVAREFYLRVGAKYGRGFGSPPTFEPHVAEAVYNEMIQQAGVQVYTDQYLTAVVKQGPQLIAATMNNGNIFRAKMFIDASYTGDLMARAGITYTIGRESTNQYGESLNGTRPPNSDFTSYAPDPYVLPGNAASGLLPLIQAGGLGTPGGADQKNEAFNFRLCLTTVATNKMAITAPTNYDAAQYELLGRYVQAMVAQGSSPSLSTFLTISSIPKSKTDINNNGAISTDFVGESDTYLTADTATRAQIWQAHINYQKGLLYFLATDPRVPANVRSAMSNYGYCQDEFTDNGGWPYELYIREGRRMVSDYVMTQSNVFNQLVVPDSIGMGGYFTDSHYCQRIVVDGAVRNEGDARGNITVPYPIAYRSLIPKPAECSNLLVPWSLSASHTAFCSIRMEPVFMILGQSAGTAACLAIDEKTSVQNVSLPVLQAQLVADGQWLQAPGTATSDNNTPSLLLDFGPAMVTTAMDMINSPGHAIGGLSNVQTNWNTGLMTDTAGGLTYSDGSAATGVSIDLGRSGAGGNTINFNDNGFTANNPLGGAENTGVYAGNSPITDAFFGGSGGANALAVGVRINGLPAGTYTLYLTARNTSTSSAAAQQLYCTSGPSATTYMFTNSPTVAEVNSSPAVTGSFVVGDNCQTMTITLKAGDSLYVAAAGMAANELRGFLNSLEVIPGLPTTNLPAVNLWAMNAQSSRLGSLPGIIKVSRRGGTNVAVTVNLNLSGTAVNGVDYQSVSNQVTLPAGVMSTNVLIVPLTNSQVTGMRTVSISLATNPAYVIGPLNSTVVTIDDAPINDWRLKYFGSNANNPGVAGDLANPAGDGVSNLFKYALGLDPTQVATHSALVPCIATNGFFQVAYTRPDPPPADITYQMEASDNLSGWCTNLCVVTQQIDFNSNDTATVISQGTVPVRETTQKFVRLQVLKND